MEGEGGREKHPCESEASIGCLWHACNQVMCPEQKLNQQPFNAQSTEPYWPGLFLLLLPKERKGGKMMQIQGSKLNLALRIGSLHSSNNLYSLEYL